MCGMSWCFIYWEKDRTKHIKKLNNCGIKQDKKTQGRITIYIIISFLYKIYFLDIQLIC